MKSLNVKIKYWHVLLFCFLLFGFLWLGLLWFLPQFIDLLKRLWGDSNQIIYGPPIIAAIIGSIVATLGVLLAAIYGVKRISDNYIYKSAIYKQRIKAHSKLINNMHELRGDAYSIIDVWDRIDKETEDRYNKYLHDSKMKCLTTMIKYDLYLDRAIVKKFSEYYDEVEKIEKAWKVKPRDPKPPLITYKKLLDIGYNLNAMVRESLGMDVVTSEIDKNIQKIRDSLGIKDRDEE
jgi:hypothetical protein